MSFSCAVKTHRVSVWVSIICFTSAVSSAVSQGVELQTVPQVTQRCRENVTLTCDVRSPRQDIELKIRLFSWVAKNKTLCQYGQDQTDHKFRCESTNKTSHHRLTLTLINMMPSDEGKYLCKLRCDLGVKSNRTLVAVQECRGRRGATVSGSYANCSFSGVYPSGTVHWFQGDTNLTEFSSTTEEEDQHGLYNVFSTIDMKKGNMSQSYNCSLWMPSLGKYVDDQQVSSGTIIRLQWISILMAIIMVYFMM